MTSELLAPVLVGVSAAQGRRPPLETARLPGLLYAAACDWAAITLAWIAIWYLSWWFYPLALLVIAGRMHALGVVLHDACHMRTIGGRPRFLWLLEIVAGYPIATTVCAMRYHHLRHHRFSGTPLDPYFKAGITDHRWRRNGVRLRGFLLVPAWIIRSYFGCLALIIPGLRTSYGRAFLQDRSAQDLTHYPELIECLRQEPKQALFFVVLAAVAWRFPVPVIAGYLVPLLVAGALNVNRVIVEHIHIPVGEGDIDSQQANTVTHDFGTLGRLFLFPRNIGFHMVHHLYPRAAMQQLPALHLWHRVVATRAIAEPLDAGAQHT